MPLLFSHSFWEVFIAGTCNTQYRYKDLPARVSWHCWLVFDRTVTGTQRKVKRRSGEGRSSLREGSPPIFQGHHSCRLSAPFHLRRTPRRVDSMLSTFHDLPRPSTTVCLWLALSFVFLVWPMCPNLAGDAKKHKGKCRYNRGDKRVNTLFCREQHIRILSEIAPCHRHKTFFRENKSIFGKVNITFCSFRINEANFLNCCPRAPGLQSAMTYK